MHLETIVRLATVLQFVITCSLVDAHEGHQPLPSTGVRVDTQNGQVTLSSDARSALGLEVEEVAVGTVGSTLDAFAESVAPWQGKAVGSAQIPGLIVKLLVRPGDVVAKNQIVAELSSRELEIVKLDYLQAANDQQLNRRLLAVTRPTAQAGAVPMQRLLELENAERQSQNRLEVARIRASALGISLDDNNLSASDTLRFPIRSPIAGRIVHSDLAEGKYVEAFEHLFEIVNSDQVWVRLQLLEKDIYQVNIGNRVKIDFRDSSVSVDGVIDRVDAGLDQQTLVSWAWVTTTHPAIIPGLVGQATIFTSHRPEKVVVPQRAVYSDGLQSYVFVEEASTRASAEYRKKNIRLGQRAVATAKFAEPLIEVLQGEVFPGDRVVVKGGHELSSLFFMGVLKFTVADQQRLGMLTAPAAYRPIAATMRLPASVTLPPQNRSVLSSQLAGTVHSHTLSPGRKVRIGETLMEIASPDFYKLQLDLLSTSLDSELTRRRANRLEQATGDAVSLRMALEAHAEAVQLTSRVQSLRKQLAALGLLESEVDSIVKDRAILNHLPIRSGMNGRIVSSTVTLGETVASGQPLIEVHDLNDVLIEAYVPSAEIGLLPSDARGVASVLANPKIQFPVALSRIGPVANEATRTQKLWLTPIGPEHLPQLRVGTLITVTLKLGDLPARLAIPSSAILRDGVHHFAFVQKNNGYVERRRIDIGQSDGEYTEIANGLEAGELVVTTGSRELQTAFASLR